MQTSEGAKKIAEKLKQQDPDYYKKIGSKGGKNGVGTKKGFASDPRRAREAAKRMWENRRAKEQL